MLKLARPCAAALRLVGALSASSSGHNAIVYANSGLPDQHWWHSAWARCQDL